MRAVSKVEGRAVTLDRRDVDTDQIIPAAWLKRVERTGFGAGLFEAWRADPGFVLNSPDAEVIVDVAERTIGMPSASLSMPFDLPDYARWRLLEGLDDIGVALRHADAITEFERRRPGWLPASGPRAHATT